MGFISWLSDQREKLILGDARSHLAPGEDVLKWVRARRPGTRSEGFAFVTPRQLIVHWTGKEEGHAAVEWQHLESWGLSPSVRGGPVLAAETPDGPLAVQMLISTRGQMTDVREFLDYVAEFIPEPRWPLRAGEGLSEGEWTTSLDVELARSRRTTSEHTMRILITILGVVLVLGGLAIVPLPGPWSLPIILAGLAVLATEYDWAKDTREWVRKKYRAGVSRLRRRRSSAGG